MGEREEGMVILLERGMTKEEAENFLVRGNKVTIIALHLPPDRVKDILPELAKISLITASVEVRFCFASNRYKEFIQTAETVAGRLIVDGTRKPGEFVH